MSLSNEEQLSLKSISVDIGDLRVDFLGSSPLLSPHSMHRSPLHLHTKPELQYIVSGTLQETIGEDMDLTIPAGSILLIPPNMLHSNPTKDGSRLVFTIALQQISAESVNPSFSEYRYYYELFGKIRRPLTFDNPAISYCLSQLISLSEKPSSIHKLKNLLAFFFIQLSQQAESLSLSNSMWQRIPTGSQYNQQYFLIEQFINTHYHEKTSTEDIASILHISRRQADRIVEQIFEKSYATLLLERRMSIANILLKKTDMTCVQISEEVGYSSYPGFYLAFRKYFGMTPDEAREHSSETSA